MPNVSLRRRRREHGAQFPAVSAPNAAFVNNNPVPATGENLSWQLLIESTLEKEREKKGHKNRRGLKDIVALNRVLPLRSTNLLSVSEAV